MDELNEMTRTEFERLEHHMDQLNAKIDQLRK